MIEMGESLVYSWLRHVKNCQIVQNNWKISPYWNMSSAKERELQALMDDVNSEFNKDGYDIFKKNNLDQLISQGECDAIGIDMDSSGISTYYGVDVAFHKNGTHYGTNNKNAARIIKKCIRTAMCLYGYMNCKDAKIYFISPKIIPSYISDLLKCINKLQTITDNHGYNFEFHILVNNDFETQVLKPVILASNGVNDTAELFLRCYQLLELFPETLPTTKTSVVVPAKSSTAKTSAAVSTTSPYAAFKIGQLANVVFRKYLEQGKATVNEVTNMLDANYSKKEFDLQYPVLTKKRDAGNAIRYYAAPLKIGKEDYYLCSQWFETSANNDRPFLEKWLDNH